MKKKNIFALALSLSLLMGTVPMGTAHAAEAENAAPRVIPAIREWVGGTGVFKPADGMRVVMAPGAVLSDAKKEIVSGYFSELLHKTVPVVDGEAKTGDILLVTDTQTDFGIDGYTMEVTSDRITVTSDTETGLVYGIVTAVQSCVADGFVPNGFAKDYSAYKLRTGMLDVARAWVPLEYVEEITKYFAYFKLNEIHLHISEHNAFRLESDIPNLTHPTQYYTKDAYRDYQKRMLEYGVTVITEIDTPAHSGCFYHAVPEGYMYDSGHINIYNENAVQLIKDLIDEYITGDDPVFVSKVFHIGTDEFPDGHNEQMRAYTDELLRHVLSRGYTPRFWGSFGGTGFNGNTPVVAEGVQCDYWATALSDYNVLLNMGYDIVNVCGPAVYIVPGGNGFVDYLKLEKLYSQWQINYLGTTVNSEIDPSDPRYGQILGGGFALWNDLWNRNIGYSVFDIFDRLRGGVCFTSEKAWCGLQTETIDPKDFVERYEILSLYGDSDPGRHNVETVDGTVPDGVRSFGFPYVADADVILEKQAKETVLFGGQDGEFYVSASGRPGYRRGDYDFQYDCTLPKDETVHLRLIADNKETILVVNDTYYYEPINTLNTSQTNSSTFVLPLERVAENVSSLHVEGKTLDLSPLIANADHAFGKTATVSGLEVNDGRFTPDLAFDGDPNTRLSFARDKDEQWMLLDLGETRYVNRVEIDFQEHISDYSILVSEDGQNFTEVARIQKGTDRAKQTDIVNFSTVRARYIRYEQHKRFCIPEWGNAYYSGGIVEFRVYGFDTEKCDKLIADANEILNKEIVSSVRNARKALENYMQENRVFESHLNALADTLEAEINAYWDAQKQPEELTSEPEESEVSEESSVPEETKSSFPVLPVVGGALLVLVAGAAAFLLKSRKKK